MSQEEFAARQRELASLRPLLVLTKVAESNAHIADFVLVDDVRQLHSSHTLRRRRCLLYVLTEKTEAVQECDHGIVDFAMEQSQTQRKAATAEELENGPFLLPFRCGLLLVIFDDFRSRAHGDEFVVLEFVLQLLRNHRQQ